MLGTTRQKVFAGLVAGLAVAGGGGAVAATQLHDYSAESKAVVADAAKRLGVTPSQLSSALKAAIEKQIDAAVADGRITKEQAAELKQRVESGDFPLVGIGGPPMFDHHGGFGPGPSLDAAASYLGVSETELRAQLESGKSLADLAKAHGESVDGLVDAMVAEERNELDRAVEDGRITRAQETQILSDLRTRIASMVDGQAPQFFGHDRGMGPDDGAPPRGPTF